MADPRDGFDLGQDVPPRPKPAHHRRADVRIQGKGGAKMRIQFDVRGESMRDVLDEVIGELVKLRTMMGGQPTESGL